MPQVNLLIYYSFERFRSLIYAYPRSISYKFFFDDYLGVSDKMSMDQASEYYRKEPEDKVLMLNKAAKLKTARMTVHLNKKGNGKASMLAKAMADSWKSTITKVVEEKNEDDTFKLEGELKGGKVVIRTSSDSSVIVEIEYNLDED